MAGWSRAIYHRQNERYYKYKESGSNKDILDADTAEALEIGSREYHDHHFKKNDAWYVQTKVENKHLFIAVLPACCKQFISFKQEFLPKMNMIFDQLQQPTPQESFKSLEGWLQEMAIGLWSLDQLIYSANSWAVELNNLDLSQIDSEECRKGMQLVAKLIKAVEKLSQEQGNPPGISFARVAGLVDIFLQLSDIGLCPLCPFKHTGGFLTPCQTLTSLVSQSAVV